MVQSLQVDATTKGVPKVVQRLAQWEYLERSIHRVLCAWGAQARDWQGKVMICRFIFEQAEIVRRIRDRVAQFPGGKPEAPVSAQLERLMQQVLLAPSADDAFDGLFQNLLAMQLRCYSSYVQHAHPIHDAPTLTMLAEILAIKEQHRLWHRNYRRADPHTIHSGYSAGIETQAALLGDALEPLEIAAEAAPVGTHCAFRPLTVLYPPEWETQNDIMSHISADFSTSIEARRLFWMIGYLREINLSLDQMQWIYDSPYMPWEFHYDESRHLWDEARHGDSGHSRLSDFGIDPEQVGVTYLPNPLLKSLYVGAPRPSEPLTPKDLYAVLFFIGMVAETGHFKVKHEAYQDFRDGGDFPSAEMMLFDIVDETMHVQYARRWLPVLADIVGIDAGDFIERSVEQRKQNQQAELEHIAWAKGLPRDLGDPVWAKYQRLLAITRERHPLSNAATCPPRAPKPM